jgi:hypothetical protein
MTFTKDSDIRYRRSEATRPTGATQINMAPANGTGNSNQLDAILHAAAIT